VVIKETENLNSYIELLKIKKVGAVTNQTGTIQGE
jgi:hypothetical protein